MIPARLNRAAQPRDYLWLGAILVLATLLRLIGLNAPLWFDEIVTVNSYVRGPWGDILQGYSMNNHYLFTLQSKLSVSLFGPQTWAYRVPAVLFGVGTVGAIWWLARDVAGVMVAHISALLVALSYHQVRFSQNARGYTELAFWSTLGMILFLRGLHTPRRTIWIAYGLTLAAAVFTHLTGAFFFAAQGLVWLIFVAALALRGQLSRDLILSPLLGVLIGLILLAAFYAPMLAEVLQTVGGVSQTSSIDLMQEYQTPLWAVLEGVQTAIGEAGVLPVMVMVMVVITACLGAIGTHRQAPLFAAMVLAHIGLTFVLLLTLGMRIWPRFFFADIGFILILIVVGTSVGANFMARIAARPQLERYLFMAVVAAMVLVSAVLVQRNYSAPKQNLAGAFELVETTRKPQERVYSVGHSGPLFTGFFGADWGNLMSQQEYDNVLSAPGPITLVIPFPARSHRMIPTLATDTGNILHLIHRFPGTLGDGDVLILRRAGDG